MNLLKRTFGSSLGKKYLMAVTGCILFIFVILHLLGNLQVFVGQETLNAYGNLLQTTPELLWTARIVLLAMVLLHIWSAVQLSAENKAARQVPYAHYEVVAASYASRTMLMSGLIIAAFIVYHLLHYTVQVQAVNFTGQDFAGLHDPQGRHDVYHMMILGFSNVWVSLFYIIGVGLLCLHLSHGISSMFQSIGWKSAAYRQFIGLGAIWISILLFLGYISIPVSVLLDRRLHLIHIFK